MNPYDNNPFENNEPRELKNERDANRELAKTVNARFSKAWNERERYSDDFARGMLVGIVDTAHDVGVTLDSDQARKWLVW